jgi:hypothetical protein
MLFEEFQLEIEKLKNQYPDFFAAIPPPLLELVTSEKFFADINQVCWDNGIKDDDTIDKVVYRVLLALFGEVPKENLAQILELGAGINPEIAKKMHLEFNRLIFSQLREKRERPIPAPEAPISILEETERTEEKPERPPKKDIYREPIE